MWNISSFIPLTYTVYWKPLDTVKILFKSGDKEATERLKLINRFHSILKSYDYFTLDSAGD